MDDVDVLAKRLALMLSTVSVESRFHLETALSAAEVGGIGGTLLVQVPRRVQEHPVIKWAGGVQQLALPL